jgi:hypothetical protein
MAKKESVSLGGLLHPGNRPEDLEGADNQDIVAAVILTGLTQAHPAEAPGPRDCKCPHCPLGVEVTVVLAPVDFRPRGSVVRSL